MARRSARRLHDLEFGQKLPQSGIAHRFTRFSQRIADITGSAWAFIVAVVAILTWLLTGPIFGFSSDWQLVVNTGTTIITFLMVFLIQNAQNRDAKAIHLKLDELLRAVPGARNEFMEAEEEDLDEIVREKRIVDQADPDPPTGQRKAANVTRGSSGNGKTRGRGPLS
jgi:low affinity Fe/Cu permease